MDLEVNLLEPWLIARRQVVRRLSATIASLGLALLLILVVLFARVRTPSTGMAAPEKGSAPKDVAQRSREHNSAFLRQLMLLMNSCPPGMAYDWIDMGAICGRIEANGRSDADSDGAASLFVQRNNDPANGEVMSIAATSPSTALGPNSISLRFHKQVRLGP